MTTAEGLPSQSSPGLLFAHFVPSLAGRAHWRMSRLAIPEKLADRSRRYDELDLRQTRVLGL
jgi:hypothetical protein